MAISFATQEWMQAVKAALNRSVSFREAAQELVNVIASVETEWPE